MRVAKSGCKLGSEFLRRDGNLRVLGFGVGGLERCGLERVDASSGLSFYGGVESSEF